MDVRVIDDFNAFSNNWTNSNNNKTLIIVVALPRWLSKCWNVVFRNTTQDDMRVTLPSVGAII